MHTIVMIIEKPNGDDFRKTNMWNDQLAEIDSTLRTVGEVDRPADNVLLFQVGTELHKFAKICSKTIFPYRTLFLPEEPKWVMSTP